MVCDLFNTVIRHITNTVALRDRKLDVDVVVTHAITHDGRTWRQTANGLWTKGRELYQDRACAPCCLHHLLEGFALVGLKPKAMLGCHLSLVQELGECTVRHNESGHRVLERGRIFSPIAN